MEGSVREVTGAQQQADRLPGAEEEVEVTRGRGKEKLDPRFKNKLEAVVLNFEALG